MLKLAFCLVLFGAAAYIGNVFARRVEQRPDALARLQSGLDGLRTRLEFRGETLRPAFAGMADELMGDMSSVFLWAAELMENQPADDALRDALLENKREGGEMASLKDEDIAIAHRMAGRIGGDSGTQQAAFALADNALCAALTQAREDKAAHARLYRAAGMLVGGLLAVLFI